MKRAFLLVPLLLLAFACASDDPVDRAKWQEMSIDDRLIYVQTLIGEAQAKDAKGGGGARQYQPVNQYVRQIDEAYGRGDERTVDQIFAELNESR